MQTKGFFAIGPNCIHKSGKRYEVIDDSPIATITVEKLDEILAGLRTSKKEKKQTTDSTSNVKIEHVHHDVDISLIAEPRGKVEKLKGSKGGTEYRGTNPFHGSEHGRNFSINPTLRVWVCYRCHSGGGWQELLAVDMGLIRCDQAGKVRLTSAQYGQIYDKARERGLLRETIEDALIANISMETEELVAIPRKIPDGDMVVLVALPRTGKTRITVHWMADNREGNYITHTHAIVEHAIREARELKMESVVWVVGMGQPGACRRSDKNCKECLLRTKQKDFYAEERTAAKLLKEKRILTVEDIPASMCPYHTLKKAEKHARYCFTVVNNINNIMPRSLTILDEEPVLAHFYPTSIEVATIKNKRGDHASKNFIAKSKKLQFELDQILNHRKKPNLKEYAVKIQEISNIIDQGINERWDEETLKEKITECLEDFTPTHREVREEGEQQSNGDELSLENCVRCLGHLFKESPVSVVNKTGGYRSIYILGDERTTNYAMDWMDHTEKVIIIGATKASIFAKEFGGRRLEIKDFRYNERFLVLAIEKSNPMDGRGNSQAQLAKIVEIEKEIWKNTETSERMPFMILTGSKKEQENTAKKLPGASKLMNEREDGMRDEYIAGKPGIFYQNSVISRGLDVDQYNLMFVNGCNFAQPFWNVADKGIAAAIIADETTNSVLRISSTLRRDIETLKVIVMKKNDVHKVEKYLSNIVVMNDDAQRIAAILKKLVVSGLTIREGRSTRKVTNWGINFKEGNAKFIEMRSSTDEIVDDEMTRSVMGKIVKYVKAQNRKKIKSVTTKAIRNHLGSKCSYELLKSALERITYSKLLEMEEVGRTHKWSVARKKPDRESD